MRPPDGGGKTERGRRICCLSGPSVSCETDLQNDNRRQDLQLNAHLLTAPTVQNLHNDSAQTVSLGLDVTTYSSEVSVCPST